MINIHEPNISFLDKIEILKSLSTNWIGKGDKVDEFENNLKNYFNFKNIITITSGTQALFEIFRLLKEKTKKREIIISSMSFVGIINSLIINNFNYIYADIDENYLSLSLKSIKEKINENTAAVVIQHYGGRPNYEIEKISHYLKEKNIYLIEDCATVIGATINDKHIGHFSDYAIWSFDCMKTITTLDGGMIYCKNKDDLEIIKNNINLGLMTSPNTLYSFNQNNNFWWEIKPSSYGLKNVLNNVTASLGISQLKKINKFIKKQKTVWDYYQNNIFNKKIKLPKNSDFEIKESYFLFWLFTDERNKLSQYLKTKNIFSTFRYYPLHKTSLYENKNISLPITEKIYETLLCIPCHKNLTIKNLKYIVNVINAF